MVALQAVKDWVKLHTSKKVSAASEGGANHELAKADPYLPYRVRPLSDLLEKFLKILVYRMRYLIKV